MATEEKNEGAIGTRQKVDQKYGATTEKKPSTSQNTPSIWLVGSCHCRLQLEHLTVTCASLTFKPSWQLCLTIHLLCFGGAHEPAQLQEPLISGSARPHGRLGNSEASNSKVGRSVENQTKLLHVIKLLFFIHGWTNFAPVSAPGQTNRVPAWATKSAQSFGMKSRKFTQASTSRP
jgi:hypothetical protein